jgi:hypothetical protein
MKKTLTLLIAFVILNITNAKSQNCITVVSAAFTNPSGDNVTWRLSVNYSSNGTKNLRTYVFNGNDTLVNSCFQSSNRENIGTLIYDGIITNGGMSMLRTKFVRRTGTCDNGATCAEDQTIICNVLDIKIKNLYAKNIGNTTEATFDILSIDETHRITFNFYMPDGKIKRKSVLLPEAKNNEKWKVVFDNTNGNYNAKKIN